MHNTQAGYVEFESRVTHRRHSWSRPCRPPPSAPRKESRPTPLSRGGAGEGALSSCRHLSLERACSIHGLGYVGWGGGVGWGRLGRGRTPRGWRAPVSWPITASHLEPIFAMISSSGMMYVESETCMTAGSVFSRGCTLSRVGNDRRACRRRMAMPCRLSAAAAALQLTWTSQSAATSASSHRVPGSSFVHTCVGKNDLRSPACKNLEARAR